MCVLNRTNMAGVQLHKMVQFLNCKQLGLHHRFSNLSTPCAKLLANIPWAAIDTELHI